MVKGCDGVWFCGGSRVGGWRNAETPKHFFFTKCLLFLCYMRSYCVNNHEMDTLRALQLNSVENIVTEMAGKSKLQMFHHTMTLSFWCLVLMYFERHGKQRPNIKQTFRAIEKTLLCQEYSFCFENY